MALFALYAHLIGTSLALGIMMFTDLRVLSRVARYRSVIPGPLRLEALAVQVALAILTLSGIALIVIGLESRADYLANPKLQAKLAVVALLMINAVVLHSKVFPFLDHLIPVAQWSARSRLMVVATVSLSNSLWLYAAFLGVARSWSYNVPLHTVFAVAMVCWFVMAALMYALIFIAARNEPTGKKDWVDSMKATLAQSGLGELDEAPIRRQGTRTQPKVERETADMN